jgi:hypothetical protein
MGANLILQVTYGVVYAITPWKKAIKRYMDSESTNTCVKYEIINLLCARCV